MNEDQEINYGQLLMGVLVIALIIGFPYVLAALSVLSFAILWMLDCMSGSHILGLPPVLAWSLVGLVLGASFGFWSVAPAIGMRRIRRVVAAIPLVLLCCLMIVDMGASIYQGSGPAVGRNSARP